MLVVPADQSEDSPLSASHSCAPSPVNGNTEKNGKSCWNLRLKPPKREWNKGAVFREKTGANQSFGKKNGDLPLQNCEVFESIKQNDLKVLRTPTISEKWCSTIKFMFSPRGIVGKTTGPLVGKPQTSHVKANSQGSLPLKISLLLAPYKKDMNHLNQPPGKHRKVSYFFSQRDCWF